MIDDELRDEDESREDEAGLKEGDELDTFDDEDDGFNDEEPDELEGFRVTGEDEKENDEEDRGF